MVRRRPHNAVPTELHKAIPITELLNYWIFSLEGPISAVVLLLDSANELPLIWDLRKQSEVVRKNVDFHLVYSEEVPPPSSELL